MIEARERELYQDVWARVDTYGDHSPGAQRVEMFVDMVRPARSSTVLDAGCGSGAGALALEAAGFRVTLADITDEGLLPEARRLSFRPACLWHDLRTTGYVFGGKFDYVYCCDVLEHIPPALTMLTVHRLLQVARKGVFLSIGTQPDKYGFLVGTPLHQTAEHFVWWRDHLGEIGQIVEGRDLLNQAVFWLVDH